ncbi:MAG: hypothetical protein MJY64_03050 [archaeon]|nr:hypothetical protein [archaeon]
MKILVIDDNVVTREVIAETLIAAKYEVEKSSDIIDAIPRLGVFKPDIIILNTKTGKNDVDTLTAVSKLTGSHVLPLTDADEQTIKNDVIVGSPENPFKDIDIVSRVNDLANEIRKKDKGLLLRLFTKESKNEGTECNFPNFEFGKSYVIFEKEPNIIYKAIECFTGKDYDVFVATEKTKFIAEKFKDGNDKIKVLKLSVKPREDCTEVSKLGTITDQIKKFISEKERPAIVFDDLLTITEANGLNSTMTMLYQVLNSGIKKRISLIFSMDDDILTGSDRELFLHNMKQYGIRGDFDEN